MQTHNLNVITSIKGKILMVKSNVNECHLHTHKKKHINESYPINYNSCMSF